MTMIRRIILAAVLMAGVSPAIAQVPAAVPALPDTERRTSYSISGTTCACNVNFALYGDSTDYQNWVEVFINGVRYDYNDASHGWTITSPSGSLSTLARPITNAVLTFNAVQTGTVQIVGARRPRRASQFNEAAAVPTRNFNQVLTDIIAQNREIWDKTNDMTGRGLFSQPGNTIGPLPLPADCVNGVLGFDATGLTPLCRVGAGSGNVIGPLSATAGHVAVFGASPNIIADATYLAVGANTLASPALLLGGDTATGLYRPSANVIGMSISGVKAFTLGSSTNVGMGKSTFSLLTSGVDNAAFGYQALLAVSSGSTNTAIGKNAGTNIATSSDNTLVGAAAGQSLTGGNNVAVGSGALLSATSDQTVAVGGLALRNLTSGDGNTAIGTQALAGTLTGRLNIAIGNQALLAMGDLDPTYPALLYGVGNVAIGPLALTATTTGFENVAIGSPNAMVTNTTGSLNVAIGTEVMGKNTTGSSNSAYGNSAGNANTTGSHNLFIGAGAGGVFADTNKNTTGSNNSFIGYLATQGSTTQRDHMTVIGADAVGDASNSVYLGRSADTVRIPGALIVTGAATVGAASTFTGSLTVSAGSLILDTGRSFFWAGQGGMTSNADGVFEVFNNAGTSFGRLQFGGTTSSFPAIKRSSAALAFRVADDSADAAITALSISTSTAATFHTTSVALTNGAAAGAGTITNAPSAGNPTKWIGINDNGTTRYIPAW